MKDRRAELDETITRFARERKWGKYHGPKNLAMAMVKEAAEVVEIFQWLTPSQAKNLTTAQRAHLSEELADTFVYLKKIADHFGIDLVEAAIEKMKKNALKYPAARNQGKIHKRR
jgi:dCTP diphosphatase